MMASKSPQLLLRKSVGMSPLIKVLFRLVIPLALCGLALIAVITATGSAIDLVAVIVLLAITTLLWLFTFLRSEVSVYEDAIEVEMAPFHRRKLTLDEITEATALQLPLRRFSLGWRFYGGGEMGLITRNDGGIHLAIKPAGGYFVSVGTRQDAEQVVSMITASRSNVT